MIPKKGDPNLSQKIRTIIQALDEGGRTVVMIAALCASAQIIVGMLVITGLGVKVSTAIINLGGGNLFFGLFAAMIVAIILGMGVPTTAAYVLAASVVVPPLISMGVLPLSAHMFVF